jgi:hypothetical protein
MTAKITTEAIEAAAHVIGNYEPLHSTNESIARAALEAAIPLLPIAGEGIDEGHEEHIYARFNALFERGRKAGGFEGETENLIRELTNAMRDAANWGARSREALKLEQQMRQEAQAKLSALVSSPGGQEVGSTHEERIALASALTWDVSNITPDEVREIIARLADEGFRLQRIGGQEVEAAQNYNCACIHPSQCDNSCFHPASAPQEVEAGEPVGYIFELAKAKRTDNGEYCDWGEPRFSFTAPCVPEGSIRNLRPVFDRPASTALVERLTKERDALLSGLNAIINCKSPLTRNQMREAAADILDATGNKPKYAPDQSPFVQRADALKALPFTGNALSQIVEGVKGAMEHGTWRDDRGVRLKDTNEWVSFYVTFKAANEALAQIKDGGQPVGARDEPWVREEDRKKQDAERAREAETRGDKANG